MLTGHDDERFRMAAQRLGANDFIVKPFQPTALLARLAAYLDMPARTRPVAALPDGASAQVWKPQAGPGPERDAQSQLINGREVLRIQREAERESRERPGLCPGPTKGLRPLETHFLRSRGLAPGGVWGGAPPLLPIHALPNIGPATRG